MVAAAQTVSLPETSKWALASENELRDPAFADLLTTCELRDLCTLPESKQDQRILGRIAAKRAILSYIQECFSKTLSYTDIEVVSTAFAPPTVALRTVCFGSEISKALGNASLSIAHTPGLALAGIVSGEKARLGVDLEPLRNFSTETVRAFLAPEEYHVYRAKRGEAAAAYATVRWCLKEAYLKAKGTGLCFHPGRIRVSEEKDRLQFYEDGARVPADALWTRHSGGCILAHVTIPSYGNN